MQPEVADKMMVVLLDDMILHTLPRIHAINKHMQQGDVLNETEIAFFKHQLKRIDHCYHQYNHDPQCRVIFSSLAHLFYRVIHRALNNQKRQAVGVD
ncbi:MAG: hypothetical protein QNJ69_10320 [Gammaproteobacteria bacterium]|nr:hypothetical protein [Gammaproteobacteria bacterium]